ncbi:hypothetical protein Y1Q_0005824 [Alligator mississippiensis]|uniref:C2H2-type domain-containing protein n=1 Tax=Alligator mississippiensis TaxID=8496 RepID=A0A151MGG3_ALLMI|nr:hypothetical protein Y1Q_0005824 [Alligator mississippiensis]
MATDSEILHFQFEQQGDAVLQKMNLLRQQNLFCDVSIYINDTEFHGHKCGKTFTQKKNLNRHIRGHMGIRPFQCMVCLKTFTAKKIQLRSSYD